MSFRLFALCLAWAATAVAALAQPSPQFALARTPLPPGAPSARPLPPSDWVQLTDGRVLSGRLHLHAGPRAWVSLDERRIGLDSLEAFAFRDGTFGVARQPEVPFPVPVKLVEEGAVRRFSTDLGQPGAGGEHSSTSTLVAAAPLDLTFVQVNRGDLLREEYDVLYRHLGRSEPAVPYFRHYRRLGSLTRGGFVLGSAVVLGGVGVAVAGVDAGVPAPLIVGSGVLAGVVSAFVVPHFRQRALRRAVRAHNASVR